jgi:hypothetical protein
MELLVVSIIITIIIGFIIYCEKTFVKKEVYYNDLSVKAMRESELRLIIYEDEINAPHPKELVEACRKELKNREKVKLKNL